MLTFPPDFTFVVQIVLFFVLWAGLKRLLFDPVMAVLDARQARTTGAREAALRVRSETELAAADYEHRLQEARGEALREAGRLRAETAAEERRLIEAAREAAGRELAVLRDTLARQAEAARPALEAEAREVARRMVERIAGRALA